MKKKLTTVEFHGTPEQETRLLAVIEEHKGIKGAMMPILQKAQEIYGYLPIEVQKIIAEKTDTPIEEVFGITTFYSQFMLNPNGAVAIAVCLGTACYVKNSQEVIDEVAKQLNIEIGSTSADGKYSLEATRCIGGLFSLDACRCIGACGLAPVLTVNGEVYGRLTKDDVATILAKYKD